MLGREARRSGSRLLLLAGPAVLALASACAAQESPAREQRAAGSPDAAAVGTVSIVILHTNDIHGQALPLGKGDKQRGGFAALAATIGRERGRARAAGAETLLVDAGDLWVGPPEGTRTEGAFVATVMNEIGYDLAALGNHEFDHGPEVVARLAGVAKFPLLAANLREKATGERPKFAGSSVTKTLGGVRVRLIGLITSGLHDVTIPSATSMLDVDEEAAVVERELAQGDAADLNVLVTHCGHGVDRQLAQRFHGRIAAIVGGHSHFTIDQAWHVPEGAKDAVLVGQTGSRSANLGRMELVWDRAERRVVRSEGHLIPVVPAEGEDPKIAALVAAEVAAVESALGVKVGQLSQGLDRSSERGACCSLGNFMTDVMRVEGQVDVAFTNRTGLRADMNAGAVKLRNLYEVDPFGNTLVTFDFTGAELRAFLEEGCSRHLLEVSGLVLELDHSKPKGSRVVSVTVGGKPLDLEKTYRIGTNSFLAEGGDGWVLFRDAKKNRRDTGIAVRDLVRRYFEARQVVDPPKDAERLVDKAAKK